jgi:hypothetical protein
MIDKIKKHLFGKTEKMLIQKELDLQKLESDLNDKYAFLHQTLIKEFEQEKELLKSKENNLIEAIEVYKEKAKSLTLEFEKISNFEESLKKQKQKHLNYVISIRANLEKKFKQLSDFEKELNLRQRLLKEKSKTLIKTRKVVEQEKDLIETTIRGKKCFIDKWGNFKKFI